MNHSEIALDRNELPYIRFYRLLRSAPRPVRASRDAMGTLPLRACRYCEASAVASSFGWWLFPPMDFSLLWDGSRLLWTWGDRKDWFLLEAAQFPGYAAEFDSIVPTAVRGYSPPFLTKLPEPGLVQIWTGYFARSNPDWSMLIRAPVNIQSTFEYQTYEGIVEADCWFGPVFANIHITAQDVPVRLSASRPLLQIQPVYRPAYTDNAMNAMSIVDDLEGFNSTDWADYTITIIERSQTSRDKVGSYALAARRRRRM